MSGAPRAGNDDGEPAFAGGAGVFGSGIGGAMRAQDTLFGRHAEAIQSLTGVAERLPIGGAPHDDAD